MKLVLAALLSMTFSVSSFAVQQCTQAQTTQASDFCGKSSKTLSSCSNNGNGTFNVGCKDAAGNISNSTLSNISPVRNSTTK